MHILIDGYNLIKQVLKTKRVTEAKREQFVQQLGKRARHKGHSLVVFFDGGQFGFPNEDRIGEVTVIYSGYRETADETIKRYLSDHRAQSHLLVSSDRELRDYAALVGVESIGALDYYAEISHDKKVVHTTVRRYDNQATKLTDSDDNDLDALMQEASSNMPVKQEEVAQARESSAHKLSKKERKHVRLKKKL